MPVEGVAQSIDPRQYRPGLDGALAQVIAVHCLRKGG
jgi:hypothetical protein